MNFLQHAIRPLLRKSAFALSAVAGMAAFAGSDNDPILGSYAGTYFVQITATVDGIDGVFQTVPDVNDLALAFLPGNVAAITGMIAASDNLPGVWKKKGSKYLADFSEAATADFIAGLPDSQAKVTAKYKKISLDPTAGITGKVLVKRTYHSDLVVVHQDDKGVFGCPPAQEP